MRFLSRHCKATLDWLPFLIFLRVLYTLLRPVEGRIGVDYYHQFTRFYLGALHFWKNGWDVPYYTASLCGGVPVFADPQSAYYSLPQFLTFIIDPLPATQISVLAFYLLGYAGARKLFLDVFGYPSRVAHLGALLFALNGFSFAHLLVGHLTHHSFLLAPWLFYFAFRARPGPFALVLTYVVYSGGMHVLVVFAFALLLVLPCLVERQGKTLLRFASSAAGLLLLTCAGKLAASWLYSAHFVRRQVAGFSEPLLPFLYRYFWFVPSRTPPYAFFGRVGLGSWEFIGFISRLLPALVVLALVFAVRERGKRAFAYVPVVGLVVAAAAGKTGLPFLRAYHNPVKILGALIPAFALVGAYALSRLPLLRRGLVYFALAFLLVGEFVYSAGFFLSHRAGLTFLYHPEIYAHFRRTRSPEPVKEIIDRPGTDIAGIALGTSSLKCEEPLFGYGLEAAQFRIVAGPTEMVRSGHFNLTHPGCFLYPGHFHCQAWEPIATGDRAAFEQFRRGETPEWGVPPWQSMLVHLGFLTVTALVVWLLLAPVTRRIRLKSLSWAHLLIDSSSKT